jgi:hypothetical protein
MAYRGLGEKYQPDNKQRLHPDDPRPRGDRHRRSSSPASSPSGGRNWRRPAPGGVSVEIGAPARRRSPGAPQELHARLCARRPPRWSVPPCDRRCPEIDGSATRRRAFAHVGSDMPRVRWSGQTRPICSRVNHFTFHFISLHMMTI